MPIYNGVMEIEVRDVVDVQSLPSVVRSLKMEEAEVFELIKQIAGQVHARAFKSELENKDFYSFLNWMETSPVESLTSIIKVVAHYV